MTYQTASKFLGTHIDPWAEAMHGTRQTVKRPRGQKVLVVTRNKSGKRLSAKSERAA